MPSSESYRRRMLLSGVPQGADAIRRIVIALAGLVAVTALGTVGYMLLGLDLVSAIYQTVFTVATVGYTELYERSTAAEIFTIVLIVVGVGVVLYNLGVLVEAITEGHLREYLWRRRMDRDIAAMRGHVIIVGWGRVGRAAAQQLVDEGIDVVVIDQDESRLATAGLPFVSGNASDDAVLRAAGIAHARALICALDTDPETVYATLSARALRPDVVIISRARTLDSRDKLVLAGATRAVNPQLSGGRRMASFALHADVAEFLDEVMHDDEIAHSIEQVRLPQSSPLVGCTVSEVDVRGHSGAQLLAVRRPSRGAFVPVPPGDFRLEPGMSLIVFGTPEQVDTLRGQAGVR